MIASVEQVSLLAKDGVREIESPTPHCSSMVRGQFPKVGGPPCIKAHLRILSGDFGQRVRLVLSQSYLKG